VRAETRRAAYVIDFVTRVMPSAPVQRQGAPAYKHLSSRRAYSSKTRTNFHVSDKPESAQYDLVMIDASDMGQIPLDVVW
jgi:hypothetical protein